MRQLLQIADTPYYILRKLLQIASLLQNAAVQMRTLRLSPDVNDDL